MPSDFWNGFLPKKRENSRDSRLSFSLSFSSLRILIISGQHLTRWHHRNGRGGNISLGNIPNVAQQTVIYFALRRFLRARGEKKGNSRVGRKSLKEKVVAAACCCFCFFFCRRRLHAIKPEGRRHRGNAADFVFKRFSFT